ncbi:MAG: diguanylate cyclase [Actinomycetota bacterium]|nr:diguanylate cyclase [Actinomycetota bacterium]
MRMEGAIGGVSPAMVIEEEATLRVLLLENNAADANLLRATLGAVSELGFDVECVDQLRPGLDRLAKGGIDVAVVNLSLPDSRGMDTFRAVREEAPDIPLLILTSYEDQHLAVTATSEGAHDYLLKNELWPGTLAHALRQAVGRQQQVTDLRHLALVDELTGLHNRRGFLGLGDQLIKVADRNAMGVSLVYCDLDGLKAINDEHGHHRGDEALMSVAEALHRTFRASDVVARVGGDEFCALLVADGSSGDIPLARLLAEPMVTGEAGGERVSLAVGVAYRGPGSDMSLEELMKRADAAMYANKLLGECGATTTKEGCHDGGAVADPIP